MISKSLLKEAYTELFQEFENPSEVNLSNVAAQLAQVKGELAAAIDRADREGVIERKNGKIKILRKNDYIKAIGNYPQKIKKLQQQLEPDTQELNEITIDKAKRWDFSKTIPNFNPKIIKSGDRIINLRPEHKGKDDEGNVVPIDMDLLVLDNDIKKGWLEVTDPITKGNDWDGNNPTDNHDYIGSFGVSYKELIHQNTYHSKFNFELNEITIEPQVTLKIGNKKINPSTQGKLKSLDWETGKGYLSSRTRENAELLFIKVLGITPSTVQIENTLKSGRESFYIKGYYNGEPIILARRETASWSAGQTKIYSKYKVLQFSKWLRVIKPKTLHSYYREGKLTSKENLLNALKIPENNASK